jgi:RNA polymerase sigma factor (sigma-70 family)
MARRAGSFLVVDTTGSTMQAPELPAMVAAAREGDAAAWSALVGRFQDAAVAMAMAASDDWDGARDAAQDAFGIAYRKLDDLDEPAAFPGWFAAIVRTACSRRSRKKTVPSVPLDGAEPVDPAQRDPAAVVAERDEHDRLRRAVETLPEAERAVVALHYLGDLSYPEVAEFLGITVPAAKKRAFSARRKLEARLPMTTDALSAARPSRTDQFRDTILLFVAIRDVDHERVRALLRTDPSLAHATEDWSVDEALETGLHLLGAGRTSALIRAAQTGDVELVRLLVEAGAPVTDRCDCAGAESPLWTATVGGDADVVEYLLAAGSDPNAAAFAGATPLHVAVQRAHDHLVPLLLGAGADPERVDDHGRTPHDWLALRAATHADAPVDGEFVPTGIRAVDLFAPLRRGSVQHWPPAVGLGQTVLLFAVADALKDAEFWLLGFEHGPYSATGALQEAKETGVAVVPRLAPRGPDAATRRGGFGAALTECLAHPGDKLVALLQGPGHAHDVMLALPVLARDPAVVATIVIEPFEGEYPPVADAPPEGFDAQLAFDVSRAKRALWPAVDPWRTRSRWYPSPRHEQLASRAREVLATVDFGAGADPPALARYLAQPFGIAEPFTSRPGERTPPAEMLDTVEGLLDSMR